MLIQTKCEPTSNIKAFMRYWDHWVCDDPKEELNIFLGLTVAAIPVFLKTKIFMNENI